MTGLAILVVDDDEDSRLLLAATLRREGAAVKTASSARLALTTLDASRPDVLVSDIGMPEIDGYELIRLVRRRSDGSSDVPALAITAFTETESREKALEAGFQAFVPKPLNRETLIAALMSLAAR